jgi:Flp pilus assembly secretin CpaC
MRNDPDLSRRAIMATHERPQAPMLQAPMLQASGPRLRATWLRGTGRGGHPAKGRSMGAAALTALLCLAPSFAQADDTAPPARPAPFATTPMRQLTQENSATLRAGVPLSIEAGAGRILQLGRAAGSVFAADPRVVEVRPASPTSLFLFGVAPGRTTIAAIDGQGAPVAQYEVTVRPSGFGAGEAQSTLSRLLPGQRVRAETRGNGIALLGEVATAAEAEQAAAATWRKASSLTTGCRCLARCR